MGKKYTKKEAVSIVISAARLYRDNFVGKRLLFIVTDKHKKVSCLEAGFDASNFHHLTGLELTNYDRLKYPDSWGSLPRLESEKQESQLLEETMKQEFKRQ